MYAEEQPRIAAFARANPENFARVITFALCTIRMPLYDAAKDVANNDVYGGAEVRSVFGAKHDGLAELRRNASTYYELCEQAYYRFGRKQLADDVLFTLVGVPGLGPAKAGFCAQMIYGVSGCLDTHNLVRFGIREREFRFDKRAQGGHERRTRIIMAYNDVCEALGGTAYLWDTWCEYVAKREPGRYDSAAHVSRLHLAPLGVKI